MARRSFSLSKQVAFAVIDGGETCDVRKTTIPVVCERIRFFREHTGLDRRAFAAALDVTVNAVSNWETGRTRPDLNLIPKICRVLKVSPCQLFDLDAPCRGFSEEETALVGRYRELTPGNRRAVRLMTEHLKDAQVADDCPRISELRYMEKGLAAGIGDPAEMESRGEPIFVYTTPLTERADYVFHVSGDSMEPAFQQNDLVLVEAIPDGPELKYGEVGAFIRGNEQFIKIYEAEGLRSVNPVYPFMDFSHTNETVYIIGRVLGKLNPKKDLASPDDVKKYNILKEA